MSKGMGELIYCYGDSNTFGFDPRGLMAYRYPKENRWVDILTEEGYPLENGGMNGRTIPVYDGEKRLLMNTLERLKPSAMTVMLGTNDLLMNPYRTPEEVAEQMEGMLAMVRAEYPDMKILLIAPVPVEVSQWELDEKSRRLGALYRSVAERQMCRFADASEWGVALSYDGVHFTEAGHHAFAKGMKPYLNKIN